MGLSYFWKIPLFLCCRQPKSWFWVSELLTRHSIPTSFFQWELLRDLKERWEEGREYGKRGKKKKKRHTPLSITSLFLCWKSARLPGATQQTCCSSNWSVMEWAIGTRGNWPVLATSTVRGCEMYRLHSHNGFSKEESVTAKLVNSDLSCRFP